MIREALDCRIPARRECSCWFEKGYVFLRRPETGGFVASIRRADWGAARVGAAGYVPAMLRRLSVG